MKLLVLQLDILPQLVELLYLALAVVLLSGLLFVQLFLHVLYCLFHALYFIKLLLLVCLVIFYLFSPGIFDVI